MARNVVVMSNCQTGGLSAALTQMLPGDHVDATMWLGTPPEDLGRLLDGADVFITSLSRPEAIEVLARHGCSARLIVVPSLYFAGFHPDLSQFMLTAGGELTGVAGPYHSRLVVWGWAHGFDAEAIVGWFDSATFRALGYTESWGSDLTILADRFEGTDLSFADWYLPLVRRGAFMLTNNHPRLDALVEMARGVARILGGAPELIAYDWNLVLPDGLLATAVVWPIYPGIGDSLDLPGAYVWRLASGEIIDLASFVAGSLDAYSVHEPGAVDITHLGPPARFGEVLGSHATAGVVS